MQIQLLKNTIICSYHITWIINLPLRRHSFKCFCKYYKYIYIVICAIVIILINNKFGEQLLIGSLTAFAITFVQGIWLLDVLLVNSRQAFYKMWSSHAVVPCLRTNLVQSCRKFPSSDAENCSSKSRNYSKRPRTTRSAVYIAFLQEAVADHSMLLKKRAHGRKWKGVWKRSVILIIYVCIIEMAQNLCQILFGTWVLICSYPSSLEKSFKSKCIF